MDKSITKLRKIKNINSLCIAILFCANLLASTLSLVLPIDNIIVILFALIWLIVLFNNKPFNINLKFISTVIIILSCFFIQFLTAINPYNSGYFLDFLVYGVLGLYIFNIVFSINNIYKYILSIQILCLPGLMMLNHSLSSDAWMGISYASLPGLLASFIYLLTVKENYLFKGIIIVSTIVYLWIIIPIASRGVLMTYIISIIIILTLIYIRDSFKRMYFILFAGGFGFFLFSNLEVLVLNLHGFLEKYSIDIEAISKLVKLQQSSDILNGRDSFYELAISGIKENFLFGNGIGSFEANTSLNYPHNLFLHVGYELGVLFLVILIFLCLVCLYYIFFKKTVSMKQKIFLWFIFSIVIFKLMFSGAYWREQNFWLFISINISLVCEGKYRGE